MEGQNQNGVFIRSNGSVDDLNSLKITLIGDPCVGKSSIFSTYSKNEFPTDYVPTIMDQIPGKIIVDGQTHNVCLWITPSQEEYYKLRALCYVHTDCFLLCYAVDDRNSFESIASRWNLELNRQCSRVPKILIGTKSDLRRAKAKCITIKDAVQLQKKIKAVKYFECSALYRQNLNVIFEESVRHSIKKENKSGFFGCCMNLKCLF